MNSYRTNGSINYSSLKKVATSPKELLNPVDISEKQGVKRGNLLDIMFSDPASFNDVYAYFDGTIPTATLLELADRTIAYVKEHNPSIVDESLILKIIKANKYWSNIKKEDTLLKKFDNPTFWKYVKFKISKDKIIIEKELYNQVKQAHKTILEHDFTKHIFDESKRTVSYQNPIFTTYTAKDSKNVTKEYNVKCLPDCLSIDEENKIIYPYDFKFLSGYTAYGFKSRFLDMYYYIQACLYTYCIRKWAVEAYPGYKVMHYKFIVISDKNLYLPLIYDPYQFIQVGFIGFTSDGKDYPGINQLLEDYMWHKQEGLWKYRRQLYENKGEIKLEI